MPDSAYDGWLRADPPGAVGDEFDGWLRPIGVSGDTTFLDVVGGAKAATKAGALATILASASGGAGAGTTGGGAPTIVATPAGGAAVRSSSGGHAAIVLSGAGGAAVSTGCGGSLTVLVTQAGGGIVGVSAGGLATTEAVLHTIPILLTTSQEGRLSMDRRGTGDEDIVGITDSAEPGLFSSGRRGQVRS